MYEASSLKRSKKVTKIGIADSLMSLFLSVYFHVLFPLFEWVFICLLQYLLHCIYITLVFSAKYYFLKIGNIILCLELSWNLEITRH